MADRAVIFDMDGVLVDSYRPHLLAWQRMAAAHGLEITEAQFAAGFGKTGRENIAALWPGRVREEDIRALDDEKEACYRRIIEQDFPEMPGAGRLMRELHAAGFALAIGSSGPPANVEVVARRLSEGRLVGATVHGLEVPRGKPDPAIFLLAARRLSVPSPRCAVVEDAPAGIIAGRAAGMTVIAVTGTAPREWLTGADLIVDSLTELSPATIAALIDRARAPDDADRGG